VELAREAGIMLCLEVKGADDDEATRIALALANLIAERGALGWAFMSSYFHGAMREARARVPGLLLAPERLPDDVPAVPAEAVRQARALGAPVIQNHYAFLTPELVTALHDGGIAVWSWPTTDPGSIASSLAVGADAVMGDDVAAMRRAVDELVRAGGTTGAGPG
jgi:glycerophosphoryl diester phosphodiesterase